MTPPPPLAQKYARFLYHHHRWIIVGAVALTFISIVISSLFLENRKGILDLYSSDNPVHRKFSEYVEEFGDPDDLIVVVQGDSRSKIKKFIDKFVTTLQEKSKDHHPSLIREIFYRIDPAFIRQHALLYLSLEDLKKLNEEVTSPQSTLSHTLKAHNLNDFLRGLSHTIQRELGSENQKIDWKEAQLGLSDLDVIFSEFNKFLQTSEPSSVHANLLDMLGGSQYQSTLAKQSKGQKRHEDPEGYISVAQGDLYVVFIKPMDPRGNYDEAKKLVTFVRSLIQDLRPQYPSLTVGVTGSPALTYDEVKTSERDMTLASIIALLTTALIFFLAFREVMRPLFGFLCLLMGVAMTFGWTTLMIGHLNLISITFAVILVGLGTQYGIHVMARYIEERRCEPSIERAVARMIHGVGASLRTGALTTAAAFLATLVVDFAGFRELGIIAGSGVMICLGVMLSVLPSLLIFYDVCRQGKESQGLRLSHDESIHSRRVLTFIRFIDQNPRLILGMALLLLMVSGVLVFLKKGGTALDYNVLNLQAPATESVQFEKKLLSTDISLRFAVDLKESPDEIRHLAEKFSLLDSVSNVQYLEALIPKKQEEKIKIIEQLSHRIPFVALNDFLDIEETKRQLNILKGQFEKMEEMIFSSGHAEILNPIHRILQSIEEGLKSFQSAPPKEMERRLLGFQGAFLKEVQDFFQTGRETKMISLEAIPPDIKSYFVSPQGRQALYVYPSVPVLEKEGLHRFVKDLRSVDPDVTGPPFQMYEVLTSVERGYPWAVLWAALLIILIFYLDFRRLQPVLWATFPLLCGLGWVYGVMSLLGMKWNLVNVITLPIVLGVGADCGVHIIHRFLEEGQKDIFFILKSTGKALTVAYLDTLTSFLGLAIASHQGLASMGQIMILGILCCFTAGIVVLPALLKISIKSAPSL